MATYPKEFLFKRRNDIDTFLSEPGLNSDIYETLLEVREPNEHRYALKVSPLDIFNEAYGQALRVIVDKHPEEDFYNHYFLDAKKYFQRSYEVDLVFCVVYILLSFSCNSGQNVKRFTDLIQRRYADKPMYFPAFQKLKEDIIARPSFDPAVDRVYLHTDTITPADMNGIRWSIATQEYSDKLMWAYYGAAPNAEYIDAISKAVRSEVEFDKILDFTVMTDPEPVLKRLEDYYSKYPKKTRELPVVTAEYSPEVIVDTSNVDLLTAEIERLKAENEELKKKREAEESEERVAKIKDIVAIAKTFPESEAKSVFNVIRMLIADEDKNWIEKLNAEEKVLAESGSSSSKYRIANRKNTDFAKIVSAMYDIQLFMTSDGLLASNKQELMEALGKFFHVDLSGYSTLLSRAKDTDSYMDVFEKLSQAAQAYYDS
ncbi:MAG: hypothetical protein J6X57_06105 [Bacteroidales bacterium]|nr:hypothetical protein [Bacteroidales bacterium]